jgi:hypothetical protein
MADLGEVIRGLELCGYQDGMPQCDSCPYDGKDCWTLLKRDALSLLKAQEPKPPRFVVTFDKIFYACDNCGKSFLVVINAEGIKGLSNMPKYCPDCGQAVKWE